MGTKRLTRREFLLVSATGAAGVVLAACAPAATQAPAAPEATATTAAAAPADATPTAIATQAATATAVPTAAPSAAFGGTSPAAQGRNATAGLAFCASTHDKSASVPAPRALP